MSVAKRTWKTPSGEARWAWVVRYYDADGKQRTETFKTEREAKARDHQIAVDLKKGIHRPSSTSATVSEAAALWLERARGEKLETGTLAYYERHYRLHIGPATVSRNVPNGWSGKLGDVKLSQLTSPCCDAFGLQLLTTNSRTMAVKVLSSFKAILKDAQRRGLIAYNPAQPVRIVAKSREHVPIRIGEHIPSKADIRAILAASAPEHFRGKSRRSRNQFQRERWHPLFLTAAFTGMRTSELRGLIWPNVDLDGCVIHVRQRVDEKGRIGPCKSQSSYRDIQISDAVVDELRRWKLICPPSPLKLVFPNGAGKTEWHADIMHYAWYPIQKRIGMTRPNGQAKYGFHGLRHFFASIMIEQGIQPKRLQSLLGHATLAETMDTYGHLFPAGEAEIAQINNAVTSVLAALTQDDKNRQKNDMVYI